MPQNAPPDHKWLARRLAEMERRIKALETAPRAGDTSVSTGKFVVRDEDVDVLKIGFLGTVGGVDVRGVEINRPGTGDPVFDTFRGGDGTGGFWTFYDQQGNNVVSDDAVSGQGLARPFLGSAYFAPLDTNLWPSTTSGTSTLQWESLWFKQQPQLNVFVATRSSAGTTGQVIVECNGASVTENIPAGDNSIHNMIFAIPGAHMDLVTINISLRRTGGTGSVFCYPYGAFGRQSD